MVKGSHETPCVCISNRILCDYELSYKIDQSVYNNASVKYYANFSSYFQYKYSTYSGTDLEFVVIAFNKCIDFQVAFIKFFAKRIFKIELVILGSINVILNFLFHHSELNGIN